MKKSLVPKLFFFLAIAYTIALLILSLVKTTSLPKIEIDNVDKIFHFLAYFGLVLLWYLHYYFRKGTLKFHIRSLLMVCFTATIFGIFIEVMQRMLTTYRAGDLFDLLANLSGIALAFIVLTLFKRQLEKWKFKF